MKIETLTVEEAAQVLKVSEQTVKRALRAGTMPGTKVGGQWRISRQLLERYLAGEWQPPAAGADGKRETARR